MRPDGRPAERAPSAWPRSLSPLFACARPCAHSRGRGTDLGCPQERDGTRRPPRPSCPSAAGAAGSRKRRGLYSCPRCRGVESRLAGAVAAAVTSNSCKTSAGSFLPLLPAGRGRPEVTQPQARLCSRRDAAERPLGPEPLAQLSVAHAPFPSLGKLPCSQVGLAAWSCTLSRTSPARFSATRRGAAPHPSCDHAGIPWARAAAHPESPGLERPFVCTLVTHVWPKQSCSEFPLLGEAADPAGDCCYAKGSCSAKLPR